MGFFDSKSWVNIIISLFSILGVFLFLPRGMVGSCNPFWPFILLFIFILSLLYVFLSGLKQKNILWIILGLVFLILVLFVSLISFAHTFDCHQDPPRIGCLDLSGACLETCEGTNYPIRNIAFDDSCDKGLMCCFALGGR